MLQPNRFQGGHALLWHQPAVLHVGGGNEIIGRVAFGIGAAIIWLCLIGFAVHGWRKLAGRGKT